MEAENNVVNVTLGNNSPTEIIEGSKDKLPKFTLSRGERFNVGLQELRELHKTYFEAVSEMKEGTAFANPELKSKMESALNLTFDEEIERLRIKNARAFSVERARQLMLNSTLTPSTWRNWWWVFKLHRNDAQILLEERVRREAAIEIKNQEDELPALPKDGESEEEVNVSFVLALQTLLDGLPRMRRKRRELILELARQLSDVYDSKVEEQKRTADELEEVKRNLEQARERVSELEELTAQLINESEEVTDDAERADEVNETEAEPVNTDNEATAGTPENGENKPEEANGGEVETPTTADGESEESLYYGELLDSEE